MSLRAKLLSASGGVDKLYVDDVFSAYTYTGNGATQTITNGIDLAGKGGMVWIKSRNTEAHGVLHDSARGVTKYLNSSLTNGEGGSTTGMRLTAFSSSGFTLGTDVGTESNANNGNYISWTFRKADKFYNHAVVTKSSGSNATISFANLGTLGMVRIKRTDSTGSWYIWHRSLSAGQLLIGNTTAAAATLGHVTVSGTTVTLVNALSADGTYLVEAFAHDPSADGIIQCGSYTGNGSATGPVVTLGWEPQYVMVKRADAAADWYVVDASRGFTASGANKALYPNLSAAETDSTIFAVNATGVQVISSGTSVNASGGTYIYLAIRRPNKPPTVGTQVYNAIARTGTGAAATVTGVGFPPDLIVGKRRTGDQSWFVDRLRGRINILNATTTNAESTSPLTNDVAAFSMDGVSLGIPYNTGLNSNSQSEVDWFFRRALGVFDIVCYTGNGGTNTQSHNLGAIPELMILKGRGTPSDWGVYVGSISQMYYKLTLQTTDAAAVNNSLFSAAPTASSFTLNTTNLNNNAGTYVAYLFATKAGISKVFNYTGNGSSQTINCGFTTGARSVLIKRTDSTGNWYVWDTVRGIIAGNDPHLSLNTTAAEVTTNDSIDPDSSGFIVNQVTATNINVTSATYIGLALA